MASTILKNNRNKKLNTYKSLEIPGLDEVEKGLYQAISDSHGITNKICTNLIRSGGKRIRPLLVLCSAQCFGTINPDVIHTAVAYELIHMASLVHDDIIDESTIRRNCPSVNALIGNQASVLVGDYLFAKAFHVMSANKLLDSMALVVEAIGEMCDGEIAQRNNLFNLDQTREDYFNRIYKKTGILIAACCQAGAVSVGADKEHIQAMKVYGTNLGYSFQIIDDILDFIGNEKTMGKPVGHDLMEGNITLPILKLIEEIDHKSWLKELFENRKMNQNNFRAILRILKESYAIEECYKEAENCIYKAKDALTVLEDSSFKLILIDLSDKLLHRKH